MLLAIPDVLTPAQVAQARSRLNAADWADGRITAGYQSAKAKDNLQLPEDSEVARELGALVRDAAQANSTLFSAALPRRIYPPLFNCYRDGQSFGFHVDNAVRYDRSGGNARPVRTDLSATLFLSDPDSYDGGELAFDSGSGETAFKLPARSAICYPTGQLHRVRPVERGERLAVVGWVQSLVREPAIRELLHDLSEARELLAGQEGSGRALELINKSYNNLLRRNAEP